MLSKRWPDRFWGEEVRERVASQLDRIKHRKIIGGGYEQAPEVRRTWFSDTPYEASGQKQAESMLDARNATTPAARGDDKAFAVTGN